MIDEKDIKEMARAVWESRFKYAAIVALVALVLVLAYFGVNGAIDANLNQLLTQ